MTEVEAVAAMMADGRERTAAEVNLYLRRNGWRSSRGRARSVLQQAGATMTGVIERLDIWKSE